MFSSVDGSDDPNRAVWYLDQTTRARVWDKTLREGCACTHAAPDGFVLDIGCGTGHDLELLASAGVRPIQESIRAQSCSM